MKKSAVLTLVVIIMFISIVSALFHNSNNNSTNNTTTTTNATRPSTTIENKEGIEKAYACLENEVEKKSSLSLQEAIFTTLALGGENKAVNAIKNEKKTNEDCWPKSSCNIKETAQVLMAYNKIGEANDIDEWLLSKSSNVNDLSWYLEIDIQNHIPAECTIKYDNIERKIKIKEDLRLEGSAGSCLSLTNSGYWLRISNSCLEKSFDVSCDEDFITTLLYQKNNGNTIYVSDNTNSASSLGTTTEKVNVKCLKTSTTCDYEGTLWAALALNKNGNNVDAFIPYLIALAEDNKRFFPSSFLHILTGGEDQYNEIVQSQKQGKYWEVTSSPYKRFYDSSLGMLALGGNSPDVENVKNYLLSIQSKEGCWNNNNIRDTAFLLYSGWPKGFSTIPGGTTTARDCIATGKSCETSLACSTAGGTQLYEFSCTNFREICCSVNVQEKSCTEKGGTLCSANQECKGSLTESGDGKCCIGTCENVVVEDTCKVSGGNCRTNCLDDEEEVSESCSITGERCCVVKSSAEKGGISMWVIVLLVILILLVILAIIYRNNLRLWWFRWRGKASIRPAGPPPSAPRQLFRPVPRFGAPATSRPVPRTPPRPMAKTVDKEFEETMRKLKEMSK